MTHARQSRNRAYFDRIYAASPDPWQFRSSDYEHGKYAATLAALPRHAFKCGLEVGCAIGELTWHLAHRCEALLGLDTAAAALAAAQARCAGMQHVRFAQMHVPAQWPAGRFDLIVLSEVLYFLAPGDIDTLAARIRDCVMNNATIVLVNWLGDTDDPCSGDGAANRFMAASPALRVVARQRRERYRIDVLAAE